MKILHTSDWHLGKRLYSRTRYDEFEAFLTWLCQEIETQEIDVLIVAGDIFDTTTPSNRVLRLYYSFLKKVTETCCRHIVIIAGNHDSPSLLEAPRELLKAFSVHVVATVADDPVQHVLTLENHNNECELIVCAVPYLRDRDIRSALAGESTEDKERILLNSIKRHYREVTDIACKRKELLDANPPIVATGHLFAAGGSVVEGDGVRDLYVGSLVHVPADIFPPQLDYLALGHLHSAQKLGGNPSRRYSGSPLPMSFNEAEKEKYVITVEINGTSTETNEVRVPVFQKLQSIRGNFDTILEQLAMARETGDPAWLEILYEGDEVIPDLQKKLKDETGDSELEILRVVNIPLRLRNRNSGLTLEDLETMSEEEVFNRCLESGDIDKALRQDLVKLFRTTLHKLHAEDRLAD